MQEEIERLEKKIKELKTENELLDSDLKFACYMLGLEYCYKEPDAESVNRLVSLVDMIPKPEDLKDVPDVNLINKKVPEKTCKEYIKFGDDFGDNETTCRCRLEEGHDGPHEESGDMGYHTHRPYKVQWFGKVSDECEDGGHKEHHHFWKGGDTIWSCECQKKWYKEGKKTSNKLIEIDEPPLWAMNSLIKSDKYDWYQAKGDNICDECKKSYSEHPYFDKVKGYDGKLFLVKICNGSLINLC